MAYRFLDIATTPSVKAAQAFNGSGEYWTEFSGERAFDRFTQAEVDFINQRDTLYMATVSETGWPYVQHRGGPQGFIKALDERTLGFADFRGNRQYISVGNISADDRTAIILMDYPNRRRLKIYARAELRDLEGDPALAERLALRGYKGNVERAMLLHLEAFDWNCPQHITPRFTEAELARALTPVKRRIRELEEEVRVLRAAQRGSASDGGALEPEDDAAAS